MLKCKKVTEKRIFLPKNLHMSEKSSTFASSKVKMRKATGRVAAIARFFYCRLDVLLNHNRVPRVLAVMAHKAFLLGL